MSEDKPKVQESRYIDHESGEDIVVYWFIDAEGRKVYCDSNGNPK